MSQPNPTQATSTGERLRTLVETTDLIIITNPALVIEYASLSAEALLGRRPEDLRGSSLLDLVMPGNHPTLRRACELALTDRFGASTAPHEYRLRHGDGSWRVLETVIKPGFSESGRPSIFINARDVTDRRRAEDRQQESEERYRVLFDLNPLPMWVFDRATLQFLAVNDAAVESYGYSRSEFLAMTIKDIRPPEDLAALAETLKAVERGERVAGVWRHRKKDGSIIDVSVRSADFPFGGWAARLVLAEDIGAKARLEEQLRQAQKMDALGRLASGVAHDFNNILAVIAGYTEQLLRRSTPQDPSHSRLDSILKAAHRAADLARQLLTFSRQDAVRPQVLNLNTVVDSMESLFRRVFGSEITLVLVKEPRLGRTKMDPTHLEQVLMNLVVNARDAMPQGGRVSVETANVTVDEVYAEAAVDITPGEYVGLTVADTGQGIPKEIRDRIFEPFFTTKEEGRGTGLGLSIVYGIVKQAGGRITVYSEPGQGTTFRIYLPRIDEVEAVKAEVKATLPYGSETILLVEDDEAVREITRDNLVDFGYTVLEAGNMPEALQVLAESGEKIAALVTDMHIGLGGSGRDVAAAATRHRAAMPVIVMSGQAESMDAATGFPSATTFLQKPTTLRSLLETVREALDRR